MPRYIDADKIKQELLAEDAEIGKPKDLETALKSAGIFHALMHIQLADAEDVAPVKHGYWKANKDESGYFDVCICSECLTDFVDDLSWLVHDMELPPFCPYCGAKMDEVIGE